MGVQLPVSLTAYSVVGAAAYMGGATRMTLTTTVMVMETTGALQLIVPIMLTVFVAKARLLFAYRRLSLGSRLEHQHEQPGLTSAPSSCQGTARPLMECWILQRSDP